MVKRKSQITLGNRIQTQKRPVSWKYRLTTLKLVFVLLELNQGANGWEVMGVRFLTAKEGRYL